MPQRSRVAQLPPEVRDELNARLVANAFAGYEGLSDWLAEQGYRIGKSSLHRHGEELREEMEAAMSDVRRTQALAKAMAGEEDREGHVLAASSAVLQDMLLRLSIALRQAEDDPAQAMHTVSAASRALADLGRMDIAHRKYREQVRLEERSRAADAAHAVARQQGMSAQAAAEIRRAILGIPEA